MSNLFLGCVFAMFALFVGCVGKKVLHDLKKIKNNYYIGSIYLYLVSWPASFSSWTHLNIVHLASGSTINYKSGPIQL